MKIVTEFSQPLMVIYLNIVVIDGTRESSLEIDHCCWLLIFPHPEGGSSSKSGICVKLQQRHVD